MNKGKLIAVEGIDGSGKSTLINGLCSLLKSNGEEVLLTKEPGGTSLGKHMLELLKFHKKKAVDHAEYLLFAADRAQHFHEVIIPALNKGITVLSDRMADSSLAYQGYGRNLSLTMIQNINEWAMSSLKPDVTLYLQLDWQTAYERILKRKETLTSFEKEKEMFWQKVIQGYETIYKNRPDVIRLDAKNAPEKILSDAFEALENKQLWNKK